MMPEIAQAIMQKYGSETSLKSALSGGLYFQQAPQNVTAPYGVFYFNGITQDEIMGGADDSIQQIGLQFNIFSEKTDGGTEMSILTDLFCDAYNWQDVYASGWHYIKMQRESILPIGYVDEIWQVTIMFSLWVQRQ